MHGTALFLKKIIIHESFRVDMFYTVGPGVGEMLRTKCVTDGRTPDRLRNHCSKQHLFIKLHVYVVGEKLDC